MSISATAWALAVASAWAVTRGSEICAAKAASSMSAGDWVNGIPARRRISARAAEAEPSTILTLIAVPFLMCPNPWNQAPGHEYEKSLNQNQNVIRDPREYFARSVCQPHS